MAYFDYGAFARDLFINDFYAAELNGYVHVFSNYWSPNGLQYAAQEQSDIMLIRSWNLIEM